MFSLKAENIYDVSKPLHLCSSMLGLTAFSFEKKKEKFVASVKLLNILSLTITTVSISVFIPVFILNKDIMWTTNKYYTSEVLEYCLLLLLISCFVFLVPINLWLFGARKYFAIILNKLIEVDNELVAMNIAINFRKQKKVILWFSYFTMTMTVFPVIMAYIGQDKSFFSINIPLFLSMIFSFIWNIYIILQYAFIILAVQMRYENINLYMRATFLNPVGKEIEDGNDKIINIALLHDKLVDVSEYINRCYGIPVRNSIIKYIIRFAIYRFHFSQLIIVTALNFAQITLFAFSATRMITHHDPGFHAYCIYTYCWAAFYSVMVYFYNHFGHFAKREVNMAEKLFC